MRWRGGWCTMSRPHSSWTIARRRSQPRWRMQILERCAKRLREQVRGRDGEIVARQLKLGDYLQPTGIDMEFFQFRLDKPNIRNTPNPVFLALFQQLVEFIIGRTD